MRRGLETPNSELGKLRKEQQQEKRNNPGLTTTPHQEQSIDRSLLESRGIADLDMSIVEQSSKNLEKGNIVIPPTLQELFAGTPEQAVSEKQLSEKLEALLTQLSPREEQVIRLLFFDGKTISEVADDLILTVKRVEQIRNKAMQRLKHPSRSDSLQEFR